MIRKNNGVNIFSIFNNNQKYHILISFKKAKYIYIYILILFFFSLAYLVPKFPVEKGNY